uniref:21S rRNA pseudouridine(2819) synthase n=1 Tax=Psilocybe cubensis TaxID=181762 RepID=A0A8H8CFR2_PSICU
MSESSSVKKRLDSIYKDIKRWIPASEPCSVHRLDKPTTGCLLVALNSVSGKSLSRQFTQGTVQKSYLALVRGGEKSFSSKQGRIEAPISYLDGRAQIDDSGKEAITEWEVLGASTKIPLSLLRLGLVTGNKHQLRIHLAKILQTPIVGDSLYSSKPLAPAIAEVTDIPENRLFLHASEISFYKYTERGKRYRLKIRSPIPPDLKIVCEDADIDLPHIDGTVVIDEEVDGIDDRYLWDRRKYN